MTRVFQFSLYSLVALASVMLATAEEVPFPTGLTLPLTLLAYFLNERQRKVRVQVFWANIAGVVAFVVAAVELWMASRAEEGMVSEQRVLAGAHLLTYLSWIALFQDKEGRQYWWLLGLSVMMVAVGSILTQSGYFGAGLILYVFLGLWTLSIFSFYQARYGFESAARALRDERPSSGGELDAPGSPSGHGLVLPHRMRDESRGAIQLDPNERWINVRLVSGVIGTTLLSLSIGVVFFISIPRVWVGKPGTVTDSGDQPLRSITGFTDEVQLGDIGQILESNTPVMEVRFYDSETGLERNVDQAATELGYDVPTFRGSVMGHYERGRWSVLPESRNVSPMPVPRTRDKLLIQRYIVHRPSSRTLFAMHPVIFADMEPHLVRPAMDSVTSILMRSEERSLDGQIEYVLYGAVPRDDLRPRISEARGIIPQAIRDRLLPEFLQLPDSLPALTAFAREIAATAEAATTPGRTREERIALAIQSRLRDSGEFSYTLNAEVTDPAIDPVEDFLVNRKSGHCEYSASAMALMLRAVGIPSRLVSGFKGGEFSGLSGAFVVEERHAHAWVEAFLPPPPGSGRFLGYWQTFDPTPATREESVQQIGAERSVVSGLRDQVASFWHQRIVRLSIEEQRHRIYAPMGRWMSEQAAEIAEPLGPRGRSIVQFLSDPRRWFSLETFGVTAVLLLLAAAARRVWRQRVPAGFQPVSWLLALVRSLIRRIRYRDQIRRIEFYSQFVNLLARHGMTRRPAQTQQEFALETDTRLRGILLASGLTDVPDRITQCFYDVRFGNAALPDDQRLQLDDLLSRLKSSLHSSSSRDFQPLTTNSTPSPPDSP